ncbi:MAG: DUF4167 domain-containing protein [Pseudomonadota bacterium]
MKRQRGRNRRSGGGGNNNNPNRHYESNGPDVKIRGSAQQILDKYLQYARDAQTSGDRVNSEAYFQHAEHYARLIAAMQPKQKPQRDDSDADKDDAESNEANADTDADKSDDTNDQASADEQDNEGRKPRRRNRKSDKSDDAEAGDDPLKVIDADASDEGEAPKKPGRRSYKRKTEDAEASEDAGDGLAATLARGRSGEADVDTADKPVEPAAE